MTRVLPSLLALDSPLSALSFFSGLPAIVKAALFVILCALIVLGFIAVMIYLDTGPPDDKDADHP